MSTRSAPRLGYIDGLRAVAALSVLGYHAGLAPHPELSADDSLLVRAYLFGAHGVDLFFVISGFCLAYPYLVRLRRGGALAFDAADFGARRLVRILPPYYAAIVVFAVLFAALGLRSPGLGPLALFQQFFFLDRDLSYLSIVFWTLAVELRWYFAFPFLLHAYARAPRAFALLGIAAYGLFYFTRVDAVDVGTLPAFMLGIWAADLEITQSRLRRFAPAIGLPCAICAFAFMSGKQYYAVQPVGVVAAFALVVAAGTFGPLRRALSLRPLVGLGIASYSIYLFHEPVIAYAEAVRHAPVWFGATASLALSLVFFIVAERPFVSGPLRDRLVRCLRWGLARAFSFAFAEPRAAVPADGDGGARSGEPEPSTRRAIGAAAS